MLHLVTLCACVSDWATTPLPSVAGFPSNYYCVKWVGLLRTKSTQVFTFELASDDRASCVFVCVFCVYFVSVCVCAVCSLLEWSYASL